MKVNDEEVEKEAGRQAEQSEGRQPAGKQVLRAERERQEEEKHDDMSGARHDQYVHGDDNELTLGLDNVQCVAISFGNNKCAVVVVVVGAKMAQLLHGQHAEGDLGHDGQHIAAHEDHEKYTFSAQSGEKSRPIAIGIACQRDIEEVGVTFRSSQEVCGRVDQGTRNERTDTYQMRRFGSEATQPCVQKREALEGDHHVEHILEEVESGGGVQYMAAVGARGQIERESKEVRREADEREGEHKRAEHVVERMDAQVLVDGLVVDGGGGGGGRVAAYNAQSGKTQHVEHATHGAEWREHEQEERVEQPRRVDLREEQLHDLGRQRHHNIRIHIAFV